MGFSQSHLQSGHVGGLQSLLQSLTEEIVTDWGPCWHGGYTTGGVRLNHTQNDSKEQQKINVGICCNVAGLCCEDHVFNRQKCLS